MTGCAGATRLSVFRPESDECLGCIECVAESDEDADGICSQLVSEGFLPDTGLFEAQACDGGWYVYDAQTDRLTLSLRDVEA